jgi:hypothetical protein
LTPATRAGSSLEPQRSIIPPDNFTLSCRASPQPARLFFYRRSLCNPAYSSAAAMTA